VSDLDESFAQLLGRQPTDKDKQDLYRVRDALKLKNNDAVWLLLMALQHYEMLYSKFPTLITEAARDATKTVRDTAMAQAQAAMEETKKSLAESVRQAAVASARQAAGAQLWKWVSICAGVVCLALLATGWWGWRRGREAGNANGWAFAQQQCQNAAAAASWANTPEGMLAYGLAKVGSIRELATCTGRGWEVKDGVCYVRPDRGKTYGWRVSSGPSGR
jgi:hypothetical protein